MEPLKRQPNIVFVLTDDQGYGDLGCSGNPIIRTPEIDRFYDESTRLTNYHVGPTCAPTRSGLFTGHYANSTGVWHTIGGRSLLRKDEWTLPTALREGGYRTGLFGKWHLGDAYPYRPQDRGFDTTVVHGGGGISQTPDYWGNDYFDDTYMVNGAPRAFEGYCTDVFFGEALKFIEQHRNRPFFCAITTNAPHAPYNVAREYYELYKGKVPDNRARFYGMITNIDENFGRLRRKLDECGLSDNTVLIFMTDNGSSCGASVKDGFVQEGFNAGLRGLKNSPYDGGHRVPFFIAWPAGGILAGHDVGELTANVDFMPTLLDLCGVPVPTGRGFHGRSLKPLLTAANPEWEERVMVTDSQRLPQPVKWRQSAVMSNRWRLINGKELYDAEADRGQRTDIAADYPDVVEQLRTEYEKWWELVSVQFAEEIPLSVGGDALREGTALTCHDWRNDDCVLPHQQGQIRLGMEADGYWEVEIEQAGEYRLELRRWPREAGRAITAGIDGDDVKWNKACIQESNWYYYTGGQALPFTEAGLTIAGEEYVAPVHEGDEAAVFHVRLRPGPAHLHAWFRNREMQVGAYYVYIVKWDEAV